MPWLGPTAGYARPAKQGRRAGHRDLDPDADRHEYGDDAPEDPLVLADVALHTCDLSAVALQRCSRVTIEASKLTGLAAAGARLTDVTFVDCALSLADFRMATLERVEFVRCVLDDADFFEARLTDVTFEGSALRNVSIDRTVFERVDLRGASELELAAARSLAGCLISIEQTHRLAVSLALAVGADIERDT